jgi:hypothetical protein
MSSPTSQNVCQELIAGVDTVIFPFAVEQIAQIITVNMNASTKLPRKMPTDLKIIPMTISCIFIAHLQLSAHQVGVVKWIEIAVF